LIRTSSGRFCMRWASSVDFCRAAPSLLERAVGFEYVQDFLDHKSGLCAPTSSEEFPQVVDHRLRAGQRVTLLIGHVDARGDEDRLPAGAEGEDHVTELIPD